MNLHSLHTINVVLRRSVSDGEAKGGGAEWRREGEKTKGEEVEGDGMKE